MQKNEDISFAAFKPRQAFQSAIMGVSSEIVSTLKTRLDVGMKYFRSFLMLRSQNTLLITIRELIKPALKLANDDEKNELQYLDFLIESLLTSTLGKLFDITNSTIEATHKIISQEKLSPGVEKVATGLLKAAISIRRISTFLDSSTREDQTIIENDPEESDEIIGEDQETKKEKEEEEVKDNEQFVVCRICDEKVPLDLLDYHNKYCLQAYKSDEKRKKILNEIKKEIDFIINEKLNVPWPGNQTNMVKLYLPLLHACLLLHRSMNVDPKIADSYDDLKNLSKVLMKIKCDEESLAIIHKCEELVKDYSRVSKALREASSGLSQTRVSKNPRPMTLETVTIADFDFIKRISSGAFASVFIAKKHITGDIYAIKAIPKKCLNQKNQTKRVITEKDILLSFSNPYIVTFYYSIIGKRNLYLVTEFVPGGDLYSLLQALGSFDEESSKIYIAEILEALKYLRQNSIIHRDIKPDNILVTAEGTLKLTDFGLSRQGVVNRQMSGENEDISAENEVVGTLDYMAPEILLNQDHTFAVDYWSLGAMLYEFLFGVPPFHADTEEETTANILKGVVPYEEDDEISPECKDFIAKLLEPNPYLRLGAKDINEIANHPWLKGVDLATAEPPFKPTLMSSTDTSFFEERYHFSKFEDKDIILDIQENIKPSTFVLNEPQSDISMFTSLSIDNLVDSNNAVASKIRRKSSSASISRDSSKDSSVDSLIIPSGPSKDSE